jgi:hypothetical protein
MEILERSGCKVIYEERISDMVYEEMREYLVIYDFSPYPFRISHFFNSVLQYFIHAQNVHGTWVYSPFIFHLLSAPWRRQKITYYKEDSPKIEACEKLHKTPP